MKIGNLIKPALVLLLVVFIGIFLVIKKKRELDNEPLPVRLPQAVETVSAKTGTLKVLDEYMGIVSCVEKALLASKISAFVLQVTKFEGDKVTKGEVLVRLDSRPIEASLASLQSELSAAITDLQVKKSIFDRNRLLLKREAISQEAYDLSKSAYEAVKARVEGIRSRIASFKADLDYCIIKAPFSGTVSKRFKNPGDFAAPGAPLIELQSPMQGYRVLVKVPQEKAFKYLPGTPAWIDIAGQKFATTVKAIHPSVDNSLLATVELRINNHNILFPTGGSVPVKILSKQVEGVILPAKSLIDGASPAVYLVKDNRISLQKVKVLAISGDLMAVSSSIEPGQSVVIADPGLLLRLHPGQLVSAQKK